MATKKNGSFGGIHFTVKGKVERRRQRYFCSSCLVSFSLTPKFTYAESLIDELAKQYYDAKPSYRDLERRYEINRNKINNWVQERSEYFKDTIAVAQELNPIWTGHLAADGKVIKYRGQKGCMYIGVDNCGDIVHVLAGDSHENKTSWNQFFQELKLDIKYNLISLVSDGNPDIMDTCAVHYNAFIYAACHYHFLKRLDRSFGYLTVLRNPQKRNQFSVEINLRNKINRLLNRDTLTEFIADCKIINAGFDEKYYHGEYCDSMLDLLSDNLEYLIPHYLDRNISKTSNLAETTIRQYERRLKTIEGFQSAVGFKNYLNVFTMFLRFKNYTDCRGENRYKNGQNRLQLAGVDTSKIDWFSYGFRGKLPK